MIKVIGTVTFEVEATCPNCGKAVDCLMHESDTDYEITNKVFENTTESCSDMNAHMVCEHCDYEFILDKVEY